MKPLWEDKTWLIPQIKQAERVFLFSDYDGTLTCIAPTPGEALLSPRMRELLSRIASLPSFILAIITGRALPQVRNLIGIENILYAGNHGLEIAGPHWGWVHPEAERRRPLIQKLAKGLRKRLKDVEGVLVEDKGLTLSLHYRLVKEEEVIKVDEAVREIISPWRGEVRLHCGKKVYEVRPAIAWGKGEAVFFIWQRLTQGNSELVFYLGDDLTDEDAFRVIRGRGVGIYVGGENPQSIAPYFLPSPEEVEQFLLWLKGLKE